MEALEKYDMWVKIRQGVDGIDPEKDQNFLQDRYSEPCHGGGCSTCSCNPCWGRGYPEIVWGKYK